MFRRFLLMKGVGLHRDCGLLALRLFTALPLFLKHGTEKLFRFQHMAAHFPDPLHIGPVPSLLFATLSDGICTLLLILGLATRWAALIIFINVGVALAFVHHFAIFGPQGDHGELIVLYLGATAMLVLGGAGKYSVDARLDRAGDGR
ncbi:MAG: DoxX family protein [Acidobacteriota bacterium]